MNPIVLDDVLRRIHNLPSLPVVVMELLASMGQDDANIEALAEKIARDQALTAKTLRLANSSFYGMTRQVTTIQAAIAILGFRTVRSLATTAALMGSFSANPGNSFNFAPFWRHAIAAAVCARELAPRLYISPDQAYTAGLLHDIGRLVLVTQFPPQYQATMTYRAEHDCHLLDAEHAVLGLDHAQVGQALTQHWKFPLAMQQALAEHHAPSSLGMQALSLVVMAADAIAHALDLSMDADDLVAPVPLGLWQQLGLDEVTLLQVFASVEQQFDATSLLLNG
jgi:putative nucleotidyltransferase with HDIG domain